MKTSLRSGNQSFPLYTDYINIPYQKAYIALSLAYSTVADDKIRCEWCEKEVEERNFGAFTEGFLVMKKMTQPYYFDSKDCLLNWAKGLVKSGEVK